MKKLLPIILLMLSCEEAGLSNTGLASDTSALQDTTIINIIQDTTIIIMDTIIHNHPPNVVITYPPNSTGAGIFNGWVVAWYNALDTTTVIKVDAVDDNGIKGVHFLVNGEEVFNDTLPPYEYSWDICPYNQDQNNEVTLLVKAEDYDGNFGYSPLSIFTINGIYDCKNICGGSAVLDYNGQCCYDSEQDGCGACHGDGLYQNHYDCNDIATVLDWGICYYPRNCVVNDNINWTSGRITKIENASKNIPNIVSNLAQLEELSFGINNNDWACPSIIGDLISLKKISFENSNLYSLPEEIGLLINLTDIELNNNNLLGLPASIIDCVNLVTWNLEANRLYCESGTTNYPSWLQDFCSSSGLSCYESTQVCY